MGKTYLLNKPQKDGTTVLCTATKEEWIAAVKGNKNLPTEQRRYFIVDCIEEGNDIDRMIIEVSYDEYRRWNSRHTISERNRKEGKKFQHLSLDAVLNESDGIELLECVGGIEDIDAEAMDEIYMKELKRQLAGISRSKSLKRHRTNSRGGLQRDPCAGQNFFVSKLINLRKVAGYIRTDKVLLCCTAGKR